MKFAIVGDLHLGATNKKSPIGNAFVKGQHAYIDQMISEWKEADVTHVVFLGDIFDNERFIATDVMDYALRLFRDKLADFKVHIIAGNHDSANRLEAPRALLTRHHVEVRGVIQRTWVQTEDKGEWQTNYDDLMLPITNRDGEQAIVLAVPYLRNDIIHNASYSAGVNTFLRELTSKARDKYPGLPLLMMAHMYAKGADIAPKDASEKIIIGGAEEVSMDGWTDHPDYLTCGHIHKRQHIWNTDWARYSGSVLPMSFAEVDYHHGVDLVTIQADGKHHTDFLEYEPQHKLLILPEEDEELTLNKLKKLVNAELKDRVDGKLDDHFVYLMLKSSSKKSATTT